MEDVIGFSFPSLSRGGTLLWRHSKMVIDSIDEPSISILFQIGGCKNGGYANDAEQDNPTYRFFPSRGASVPLPVLSRTLPANLYPLTWLLPSGRSLIRSDWETILLNSKTNEIPLDNMPHAVRVYPASAGTLCFSKQLYSHCFVLRRFETPDKWSLLLPRL